MFQPLLNITLYFSFFLFLSINPSFAQFDEGLIIARVGEKTISKSEFESRLNFIPKKDIQDKKSSIGIKKELLYTLIAEKLWASHAESIGYENNKSVQIAFNSTLKMFTRDELYRVEIKENNSISDSLIDLTLKRSNKVVELLILSSPNKSTVVDIMPSLKDSINYEEQLSSLNDDNLNIKNIKISFGDLEEKIEDKIYSMNINEMSEIIEMDNLWNLFIVKSIENKPILSTIEFQNQIEENAKTLSKRLENKNYDNFHKEFFKGKKVNANGNILKVIGRKISEIFYIKEANGIFGRGDNNEKIFVFDSRDVSKIIEILPPDERKKDFLLFEENPIDVETFIREISFLSFKTNSPNYNEVIKKLNSKIKEYIKHELLAREGFRRGLDQSPNVQKWVKIWYENYLYQAVKSDFLKNEMTSEKFDIEQYQEAQNKYENFINKTIELSELYDVNIDDKELKKIQVGNINLFVLRRLGFGGSIAAVPSSPPFIEWYTQKQKKYKQNL